MTTEEPAGHPVPVARDSGVAAAAARRIVHAEEVLPALLGRGYCAFPGAGGEPRLAGGRRFGHATAMVRINRVYTRAGDDGTTALGGGQRVPKDSLRIEAYGTVDELNSALGVAAALGLAEPLREPIFIVQQVLFNLGSDLCILESDKERLTVPRIEPRHVEQLERWIDAWNAELEPLRSFVLPGGDLAAAQLHVARTVCRRAERRVIALSRVEPIGAYVIPYLNRLGDFLFVAARYQAKLSGKGDVLWDSRAF